MPAPKMPTAVLDARGAFQVNPERRPKNEPIPSKPVGSAPRSLGSDEKKAWRDIVSRCCKGVLSHSDEVALELAAALLAEFRADKRKFTAPKMARLHALLGSFGMTPADRTRVAVVHKPEVSNSWDDF